MTKLKCPACPRTRGIGHYLCQTCWAQLAGDTRRRLSLRDGRALRRLRELHSGLEHGRPLREIRVSR
ncbi:hypothetical protein SZN_09416 [Streptomyces zinciresistens K42]|uniref:Uncharacterized protein n=1 Tax=Streptomyces zinciresistens K42 TaxID=700597 RepID=G2G8R5_9ACTN|nr:hypothetical protein [Streptomyces zinciresistens]EGX60130.1 hypothetical protein SZN_09416 [Streptomyces zinciresistens K42]